ncbi:MAG: DNA primase [Candidatus Aureabacteria bacterium]|nr:DNA primase [Candidatus Auribacterota bacterium]
MPFIKQEDIDTVLASSDIADVIQRYIPLKASGSSFKARCPFHNEKTASFVVSRAKQIFHCFGCGAGGNVFSFIVQHEKVSFPEAVRILADMQGITITEETGTGLISNKKIDYYRMNKLAAEFFHKSLLSGNSKNCRAFLEKRGIKKQSIDDFFIGYAPNSYDLLLKFMKSSGFSIEDLMKAGLIIEKTKFRESSGRFIDKFRDRVVFPIRNSAGKIVGFSGRCLRDDVIPKYLNTQETSVFKKREILYGFYEARRSIQEKKYAYLMEGHIDVILSHQEGLTNTVGVQGTSLTREHIKNLKNYTNRTVLCFDGDEAGIEAAKKTLPLFLEYEMQAEAMILPKGEDPASILQHSGREGLKKYFVLKKTLFDFKLDNLKKNNNILTPEEKISIINDFCKDLLNINNRILKDECFKKLAFSLDVDEYSLRDVFVKFKKTEGRNTFSKKLKPIENNTIYNSGEYELLRLLINDRNYISQLKEKNFNPDTLEENVLKNIFLEIYRKEKNDIKDLILCLQEDPDAVKLISRIASVELKGNKDEIFCDCLRDINKRNIKKRQGQLQLAIKEREAKGEEITDLLSEFQELIREAKTKGCV